MKKAEFVKLVAEKLGTSQKEASVVLEEVFGAVEEALVEHGEVPVGNLGKFVVTERSERNGVNPKTGESLVIPATNVVKFKASKHIKEAVK